MANFVDAIANTRFSCKRETDLKPYGMLIAEVLDIPKRTATLATLSWIIAVVMSPAIKAHDVSYLHVPPHFFGI
jgi:hypothetical protein